MGNTLEVLKSEVKSSYSLRSAKLESIFVIIQNFILGHSLTIPHLPHRLTQPYKTGAVHYEEPSQRPLYLLQSGFLFVYNKQLRQQQRQTREEGENYDVAKKY